MVESNACKKRRTKSKQKITAGELVTEWFCMCHENIEAWTMCTGCVGCASRTWKFSLWQKQDLEMHLAHIVKQSWKMLTNIHTHPNTNIQMTLQKDNEKRLIQSSNSDTFNIYLCSIDNETADEKKTHKKDRKETILSMTLCSWKISPRCPMYVRFAFYIRQAVMCIFENSTSKTFCDKIVSFQFSGIYFYFFHSAVKIDNSFFCYHYKLSSSYLCWMVETGCM